MAGRASGGEEDDDDDEGPPPPLADALLLAPAAAALLPPPHALALALASRARSLPRRCLLPADRGMIGMRAN